MKRIVGKALLVVAIGVSSGGLHSLAIEEVQRPENGVHLIDLATAKRLLDQRAAVFVDARSSWPYQLGHVPGASPTRRLMWCRGRLTSAFSAASGTAKPLPEYWSSTA